MTGVTFGQVYADEYDLLYHEKDYQTECDLIQGCFSAYARIPVVTILDLGCGTGNHAMGLARLGYQVTGIDRSPAMLRHGRTKAGSAGLGPLAPAFHEGDIRTLDIGRQFDAVIMMFAVLSYLPAHDDVTAVLEVVRRHLKPGGVFVCDFWYGPAVLAIRPERRIKAVSIGAGEVIRAATARLDAAHNVCEVEYHLQALSGGRILSETIESHRLRFFFPDEVRLLLV